MISQILRGQHRVIRNRIMMSMKIKKHKADRDIVQILRENKTIWHIECSGTRFRTLCGKTVVDKDFPLFNLGVRRDGIKLCKTCFKKHKEGRR